MIIFIILQHLLFMNSIITFVISCCSPRERPGRITIDLRSRRRSYHIYDFSFATSSGYSIQAQAIYLIKLSLSLGCDLPRWVDGNPQRCTMTEQYFTAPTLCHEATFIRIMRIIRTAHSPSSARGPPTRLATHHR